jgi:hypothetical protein
MVAKDLMKRNLYNLEVENIDLIPCTFFDAGLSHSTNPPH